MVMRLSAGGVFEEVFVVPVDVLGCGQTVTA